MSHLPRLCPIHRVAPSWVAWGMIVVGVVHILLLATSSVVAPEVARGTLGFAPTIACMGVAGVCMLSDRYRYRREMTKWAKDSISHGLHFDEQVTEADIEPFLDSPLFRFGDANRDNAYSHTWGTIDGRPFSVLNYRYGGRFFNTEGKKTIRFFEQTVFLFPDAGLPEFHLSPEDNDWNRLGRYWPSDLEVGKLVRIVNPLAEYPAALLAHDIDTVRRLFTRRRIRRLGTLSGWTIESLHGHLVIYYHADRREYADLPDFIKKAARFVEALCRPEVHVSEPPPDEEPGQGDQPPSSLDGVWMRGLE